MEITSKRLAAKLQTPKTRKTKTRQTTQDYPYQKLHLHRKAHNGVPLKTTNKQILQNNLLYPFFCKSSTQYALRISKH